MNRDEVTTYYISGPMRGVANLNFDTFHEVADYLRYKGHQVFNPAENFGGDQDVPYEVCMREDLAQVLAADVLVLLPGWHVSEGARLEVSVAKATGKQFHLAVFLGDDLWAFREAHPDETTIAWAMGATPPQKGTTEPDGEETIEQTARRLVYGDRQQDYGPPTEDFARTGRMWSAILGLDYAISPEKVAVMMAALKLSRLAQTPDHKDSRVDTIGYMLCLDRVLEDRGPGLAEALAAFGDEHMPDTRSDGSADYGVGEAA